MDWLTILLAIAVSAIRFGQALEQEDTHDDNVISYWLVIKAVLNVVFLVPFLFVILIKIFDPSYYIACALIIMGCSPTANISNNLVSFLGGNPVLTKRIELLASLFCIVTTPLLLELIEILTNINLNLNMLLIIQQLALSQVIPTLLGMLLKRLRPRATDKAKQIIKISSMLLLIIFVILIIEHMQTFAQITTRGYIAVIIATICAFISGAIFSDKHLQTKISISLETSLRNPGLAFLIASENLSKQQADNFFVPYTVILLLVISICIYILRNGKKILLI